MLAAAALAGLLLAAAPAVALAATVNVKLNPATVNPGAGVVVMASCTSGSSATVSSTAFTTATMGKTSTGLSALVTVPTTTTPGAYGVHVACANGDTGDATLTVAPAGGATTGDGTMAGGPNPGLAAAGLALLAAAAGLAFLLLRRRADA